MLCFVIVLHIFSIVDSSVLYETSLNNHACNLSAKDCAVVLDEVIHEQLDMICNHLQCFGQERPIPGIHTHSAQNRQFTHKYPV